MNFKKHINQIRVFIEKRSFLFSFLVVVGLIFIILLSPKIFRLTVKAKESFENKQKAEQNLVDLKTQKVELENDLNLLNTNFGLESEIRDKFPVVKEGEEMVVFVHDQGGEDRNNTKSNLSLWQRIKNLFK